jgi:hypothetical protein
MVAESTAVAKAFDIAPKSSTVHNSGYPVHRKLATGRPPNYSSGHAIVVPFDPNKIPPRRR